MALTRAQYLAGNTADGVVLTGEPQGVRQGTGITIAANGVISVNGNDPSLNSLVRTNNSSAYNNYVWPNTIPGSGTTFLNINAAGVISWSAATGFSVTSVTAGAGLTGGGGPGPVTLNVGAGTGITVAADTVGITNTGVGAGSYTLANFTVNAQGQLTTASSTTPASVAVTSVTAGAGLTGGGGPGPVTLNVGAGTGITVAADTVGITNTSVTAGNYTLGNFTVNARGQLTAASSTTPASVAVTSVTAGAGLTGGGGPGSITLDVGAGTGITVAANTVGIANTGVGAGSYQNANITVNAQGQITAASTGNGGIPAGSVLAFFQASAPTGFTQVTTQNNRSIRIVNGAGGGTGGTVPFSTLFSTTSTYTGSLSITSGTVGATTLTVAQLAGHTHGPGVPGNYVIDQGGTGTQFFSGGITNYAVPNQTGATGGNTGHAHTLAGAAATGTFTTNLNLQYIDMILARKN